MFHNRKHVPVYRVRVWVSMNENGKKRKENQSRHFQVNGLKRNRKEVIATRNPRTSRAEGIAMKIRRKPLETLYGKKTRPHTHNRRYIDFEKNRLPGIGMHKTVCKVENDIGLWDNTPLL